MTLIYRTAVPNDIAECIELRGKTRDNSISVERLKVLGVTHLSWSGDVAAGNQFGYVCLEEGRIVGYCFGDRTSGEIVVLALLPEWEGNGIGRKLLDKVVQELAGSGLQRVFLGCSSRTQFRSHGFYRHLGWTPTGIVYANQDEELEYFPVRSEHD